MKIIKYIIVILFVVVVVYILATQKKEEEALVEQVVKEPIELCFTKYGPKNESGFYDKYILRLKMSGENREVAEGELRLLPAEKDALVGKFTGTVGPVDRYAMARTADLWWEATGEGITNTQQLRIIFGEGTASIGFGEMVEGDDGVYVYKDISKVDYSLNLTDTSCEDLNEKEN